MAKGIVCPRCGRGDDKVIESRPVEGGIGRRRQCPCGERFTSYEVVAHADVLTKRGQGKGNLVYLLQHSAPPGANFTIIGSNVKPNQSCPTCMGTTWQKIFGALWRCPNCGTTAEVKE